MRAPRCPAIWKPTWCWSAPSRAVASRHCPSRKATRSQRAGLSLRWKAPSRRRRSPPGNLKARFFVSEPDRAKLHVGEIVKISCDGCPPGLTAKINFIARDAEFTPPVIFSEEQRKKLVFLVEARPQDAAAELTAGQPITVSLASDAEKVVRR